MLKNRVVALTYRIVAFLVIIFGLLYNLGIFSGTLHSVLLLYYTIESNIAALVLFGVFIFLTARKIKTDGTKGSNSFFPRTTAGVTIAIMLTFLVFWCVLFPFASEEDRALITSYDNLSIHFIAPLLMLFDYILFCESGRLKKFDPLYYAIVPLVYLIITLFIGFSGRVVYQIPGLERWSYFPYFFLDPEKVGLWMIAFIAGLTAFYLGLCYFTLWIDKKRGKREAKKQPIKTHIS